ncbi:MAG TPA: aldo/keto reductase [Leptospiraceae bacterium]|nr:aldo/keto reductase [Leptospiraceae bacterium]HMW06885.1 aldo/keto reductase [Leptospiraceae bacterium]HMX34073.1 aldo/keto reductase [Leptospiraceae bacterium]HMY32404.1 aldo/keto reductase [Leptospiraceae bacterium]HMZ65300.1 aldo/keto reductase [Leptospiraceae bacterium]
MKKIKLGNKELPVLGLGLSGILPRVIQKNNTPFKESIVNALSIGYRFLDTAEIYGFGESEKLTGEALYQSEVPREKITLSTKVWFINLSRKRLQKSCEMSLRRLKTDYIDIYSIHWPNPLISLDETIEVLDRFISSGKIRYVGICNAKTEYINKVNQSLLGKVLTVQFPLNYIDRKEEDKIIFLKERNIFPVAYSPLKSGMIQKNKMLKKLGVEINRSPEEIALQWLKEKEISILIRSLSRKHLIDNFKLLNG